MRMLVIKDGKILRSFKDEQEYLGDSYLAPMGSFIRWETGHWSIRGTWGYVSDKDIPDVIRAIALLED